MYDNKTISPINAFNSVEVLSEKAQSLADEWIAFKDQNEKRKKALNKFLCVSNKDTTLFLSIKEIIDKIYSLVGVSVTQDWVIENFKESLVEFKIQYKNLTFKEFISNTDHERVFDYFQRVNPTILDNSIEAITYIDAKFLPLKTIEIMNEILADRLIWKDYNGA